MFQHVKVAIRRSQERARHRRDYRALLELEERSCATSGSTATRSSGG